MDAMSRNAWLAVLGGFMGLMVGQGMLASTFSIFFAAVMDSFAWDRAAISFAYSLHFAIYGFCGPLVGRLCETLGPRKVLLSGALFIGGGFAALGAVQQLWQFYALYSALGVATAMTGMIAVTVLVSRWFVMKRGVALGIAFSGVGVAGFLLSPLCHLLIETLGWRLAYVTLGAGLGSVLFIVVLLAVGDRPVAAQGASVSAGDGGMVSAGDGEATIPDASGELSLRMAMMKPSFWLLAGAGLLFFGALSSIIAHLVPLATDRGLSKGGASVALGLVVGMGAVGKVLMGYLADRFGSITVLMLTFLLQAVAIFLAAGSQLAASVWVFAILFGIAQGGALTVPPLVMAKLFGNRALGSIVGVYLLLGTLGSLIGPPMAGAIRDATGTYDVSLLGFAVAMALAAFLVLLIQWRLPGRIAAAE